MSSIAQGRSEHFPTSRNACTFARRVSGSGDDFVRVFYLRHTETAPDLQEVATLVRSMAEIRRLFIYNAPRAVVLRGTADQIALAEWLLNELDKPTNRQAPAQQLQNPAIHEYRLPGSSDNLVRVSCLTHAETAQRLQEIAAQVRSITEVRQLFTYNAPRAVALRGTAGQIALADRLIKEWDK